MINDLDLWKSIQLNDEKAFSTLFHRYSPLIYSTAWSYIRDREICEQIIHDIFLSLWKNRKTLEIKSFKGYLTSSARYQVYKHISLAKNNRIDYKDNFEGLAISFVRNTGYDALASIDLEKKLECHLALLPKRSRDIFLMSRKELLSNDEISNRLGISKRSVENQITNALKHIRISFKKIF